MPAIIVLDPNMTVKNGREVLGEINSNPRYRSIPVVILTSSDSLQDVDLCYDLGAKPYAVKPPSLSELMQATNRIEEY